VAPAMNSSVGTKPMPSGVEVVLWFTGTGL
jgi:hypothetical protein